eukprot:1642416-Amphidinium_carterae.1
MALCHCGSFSGTCEPLQNQLLGNAVLSFKGVGQFFGDNATTDLSGNYTKALVSERTTTSTLTRKEVVAPMFKGLGHTTCITRMTGCRTTST